MIRTLKTLALAIAAAFTATLPANAQFQYEVPENVVRAQVLPGWRMPDGSRMAALRLILAPGWKTYWRAPGDAGIPAQFNWAGSRNVDRVRLHWPTPDVFYDFGVRTIGYQDQVVLPMELRPAEPDQPLHVTARVDLGVCETVCVPAQLSFEADLTGDGGMDPVISAALADRPMTAERAGVSAIVCELTPISDGMQLDARIEMPRTGGEEITLVEAGDPGIWVSEPQVARRDETLHVRADLVPPPGTPLYIARDALRFTVIGTRRAVDIQGC